MNEVLYRNNVERNLDYRLTRQAFKEILEIEDDNVRNSYLATFLNGVVHNKPQPQIIKAIVDSAFEIDNYDCQKKYKIKEKDKKGRKSITLSGSGKKGLKTFNISSAAMFIASCKDILISKPCSSSTSSTTGSSEFISILGANINIPHEEMISIMEKTGIGFFSIENTIPKFDKLYGGLFFAPHALSFCLAGLLSPVETDYLLYGLAHPNLTLSLSVFKLFNLQSVFCVNSTPDGIHYIDELLPLGTSSVQGYKKGEEIGSYKTFSVSDLLDLPNYSHQTIKCEKNKEKNVLKALTGMIGKGDSAVIDTIAINSGTILYQTGQVDNMRDGYETSIKIIKSGEPIKKMSAFILATGGDTRILEKYIKIS